jgi:hypothetical protein
MAIDANRSEVVAEGHLNWAWNFLTFRREALWSGADDGY